MPRPETETVVEGALDFVVRNGLRMEKLRILDIGTGSGALLAALLSELPNAIGLGTDISRAALETARTNVTQLGFENRCSLIACDMAAGVQGQFDLLVSNPPYIARGDIASLCTGGAGLRPDVALDGGEDGWLPTVPFQRMQSGFWRRADDCSLNWVQDRNQQCANYLPMRDLQSGSRAKIWLERRVYSAQVSCHERVAFPPDENCRAHYCRKNLLDYSHGND